MLDKDFWDELYNTNETRWDLKSVSPPLKAIIDSTSNINTRILIPGCGNAYEAAYLVEKGFTDITVIDIASIPVKNLRSKFSNGEVKVLHGDFFSHNDKYDLILEQTFFCALNPKMRNNYVTKCYELLNQGGSIRGVLFNIIFEKEGPPFGGTSKEYTDLFSPFFYFKHFEPCLNSIEKRKGNEIQIEFQKKEL